MSDRVRISKELADWLKKSQARAVKIAVERDFKQKNPEPDSATAAPEILPTAPPASGAVDIPPFESELGLLIASKAPVVWVRLNETSAEVAPKEEHFRNPLLEYGNPQPTGVISGGYQFDGTNDGYVLSVDSFSETPSLLLNSAGEFTVEFLAKYEGAVSMAQPLSWVINGMAFSFERTVTDDTLRFSFFNDDNSYFVEVTDTELLESNVQHHIAATYNGTTLKLFLDGVLVDSEAVSDVIDFQYIPGDQSGLAIGFDWVNEEAYWNGTIAEVAIYDQALSDADVLDHATASKTATETDAAILPAWPSV